MSLSVLTALCSSNDSFTLFVLPSVVLTTSHSVFPLILTYVLSYLLNLLLLFSSLSLNLKTYTQAKRIKKKPLNYYYLTAVLHPSLVLHLYFSALLSIFKYWSFFYFHFSRSVCWLIVILLFFLSIPLLLMILVNVTILQAN